MSKITTYLIIKPISNPMTSFAEYVGCSNLNSYIFIYKSSLRNILKYKPLSTNRIQNSLSNLIDILYYKNMHNQLSQCEKILLKDLSNLNHKLKSILYDSEPEVEITIVKI